MTSILTPGRAHTSSPLGRDRITLGEPSGVGSLCFTPKSSGVLPHLPHRSLNEPCTQVETRSPGTRPPLVGLLPHLSTPPPFMFKETDVSRTMGSFESRPTNRCREWWEKVEWEGVGWVPTENPEGKGAPTGTSYPVPFPDT